MYTIYANDNNELIISQKKRIMQRSKLVDSMHFLVPKMYGKFNMSEFTCMLEYVLPVSKTYKSEILTKSEEMYNTDYLEYLLPLDTVLTSEAGDIEVQLTFVKAGLDEDGNAFQYVRKTSTTVITIVPITRWADVVPDSALNAVDQKLIAVNALLQELEDVNETLKAEKADDISLDDGKLQLIADGNKIGTAIDLNTLGEEIVEESSEGLIRVII